MKKIVIATLALLLLAGCGSGQYNEKKAVNHDDFMTYVKDPNHKDAPGRSVKTGGFLYDEINSDESGTFYQLIVDGIDRETSIVVHIPKDNPFKPTDDNRFVTVTGVVNGIFEAETYSGSKVSLLAIEVNSIESTDYMNAFGPALKTIEPNLSTDQNGFKISISKIEFSAIDTRVYLKYENNTDTEISSYTFDVELLVGSQKYTENSNYMADYPEAESSIKPHTTTEGIVAFDPLDFKEFENFTIMIDEPYAKDSQIDFTDYIYQVSMK